MAADQRAKRVPHTEGATSRDMPTERSWPRAVQIVPRDLDGFRVFEDTGEIFQVELGLTESSQLTRECPTRNMSSATAAVEVGVCTTSWIDKPVVSSTNLSDADALYLDAKVADGRPAYFSSHHYNFSRHLPLSDEPREVQAYAMSDDFRRANSRDLALLQRAEARIERWVSLPDNAKALRSFQAMHARVVAQCDAGDFCSTKPQRGVMHGTASGRRLDQGCVGKDPRCLWGDNGCGYQCMDSVAAAMAGGRACR